MSTQTGFVVKMTPDTPNSEGLFVPFAEMPDFVDLLAGRPGVSRFVRSMRPSKVRVYIAADRGSRWRQESGRSGFIVERVEMERLPLSVVCRDCSEAFEPGDGCGVDHYALGGDGWAPSHDQRHVVPELGEGSVFA